jgi:hypothetical protein
MTIKPRPPYLSFGIQLYPEPKKFLCLSHGFLSDLNDCLSNLFRPTSYLHFIVNPSHVLKVSSMVKPKVDKVFFE